MSMLRVASGLAFVVGICLQIPAAAQDPYLGTWTLDATSVSGHIPGLRPETTVVLTRSDGELSVTKDDDVPEIYRGDGSASAFESTERDVSWGVTTNSSSRQCGYDRAGRTLRS